MSNRPFFTLSLRRLRWMRAGSLGTCCLHKHRCLHHLVGPSSLHSVRVGPGAPMTDGESNSAMVRVHGALTDSAGVDWTRQGLRDGGGLVGFGTLRPRSSRALFSRRSSPHRMSDVGRRTSDLHLSDSLGARNWTVRAG